MNAIEKTTRFGSYLALALVGALMVSCKAKIKASSDQGDGQTPPKSDQVPDPKKTDVRKLRDPKCIDPDLEAVKKGVRLMLCDGTIAEGKLDPQTSKKPTCTQDGEVDCVTSSNFPAVEKEGLGARLLHGASYGGVTGSLTLPAQTMVSEDAAPYGRADATKRGLRRGGYVPGDGIRVVSAPGQMVASKQSIPITVQLVDFGGNAVPDSGITVEISTVSMGSAAGTTSAVTDGSGKAEIGPFSLDTAGLVELTLSAEGYTDQTLDVEVVSSLPSSCSVNDADGATVDGGCLITSAGLVVSRRISAISWHDLVWDSEVTGAEAPDEHDGDRTNDYAGGTGVGTLDQVAGGLCHDLTQGDYKDWRAPTLPEATVIRDYLSTHLPGHLTDLGSFDPVFWTSTTVSGDGGNAWFVTEGGRHNWPKNYSGGICEGVCGKTTGFCVRSL